MKKLFIFCSLLLIFTCNIEAADDTFELRYQFVEGDHFFYELKADGTGTAITTFPAQARSGDPDMKVPLDMAMFISLDSLVAETFGGGSADIETRINNYALKMAGSTVIDFNRDRKSDKNTGINDKELELMLKPVRIKMDPLGNTSDIRGIEDLSELFQPLDLSQVFTQMQPVFPDHPVSIGDTWTQTITIPGKDHAEKKLEVSFKLMGMEEVKGFECAAIESTFEGDFTYLLEGMLSNMPSSGMEVDYVTMAYNGTIYFYPEAGILLAIKFRMDQEALMRFDMDSEETRMKVAIDLGLEGLYELQ